MTVIFWALSIMGVALVAFTVGLILGSLSTEYRKRPPRPTQKPDLRIVEGGDV